MQDQQSSAVRPSTRAGYVALVGRPNVGKSTLLNALIGEKLSIVTTRAQTTREQVFGILTSASSQLVFVDTPGLLEPTYRLQQSMLHSALAAMHDADVVLVLLDGTRPGEGPGPELQPRLRALGDQLVCAINKADQATAAQMQSGREWALSELGCTAVACSARTGQGLEALQARLVERLPESPFLYPADDLAVQPTRFFVEELVRETVFELYEQEVPYATVVRIEEFREEREPLYIRATIYVERASQKPILLGRRGAGIRELGQRSREKIEQLLDRRVFLDLWVKALPGWRNNPATLRFLGYSVRDEEPGK